MNKRKKNKKIKNRHWPFIALPFAFSFLFSFILFYSVARSEEREKKVAAPNNKTITICVYWSLNKQKKEKE
jgi:hypothetical protein